MKRWMWLVVLVAGCQKGPTGGAPIAKAPQTDEQKTLYALGANLGRNVGVFALGEEELGFVQQGFKDQALGKALEIDFNVYAPKVQELARARGKVQAEAEKQKGAAFLEEAAKGKGAVKTDSGLVFVSVTEGAGASPLASDTVQVHYRGTRIDGKEFDSSLERGQPASFPLNGVVRCWTEGLQKMKVGGKARLVCPPELAYGDRGQPPKIPGGATLLFDVELLGIVGQAAPPPAHP